MIKFAHIVYIPMTGVGIWGMKSNEWLEYRIDIFKKYTLQSLLKQTNRAFMLWISFRPEERNNPIVNELSRYLLEVHMPNMMTFDGLMYWDDKFSSGIRDRVMNIGRIIRQTWREKDIKQLLLIPRLFEDKNGTIVKRLEKSLFELRKFRELQDANYIYMTRIDSDDMFHHEAITEIQRITPFEGALVYGLGYIYDSVTRKMAVYNPKTNPPFHTIIFLGSSFFNPLTHFNYYKDYRSHEDVPRIWKTHKLEDFRYCVLVHEQHISTHWNHSFRGIDVDPNIINEFL